MAGVLQPLDQKFAVVDAEGRPTDYFTRWAQQRMDDIVAAATADQVTLAIDTWAAARLINTASPLEGGGSLATDLNLSHAASGVVAGTYGDAANVAQITVDGDGHITAVVNVAITGGGGGSTAWSSITGTPTSLAGYGITDAVPLSHVGSGGVSQHALVVAAGAAGFMSGADKTKLDGIAAGATANATDAFLLARANHTGTQGVGTITGLGYFATGTDAANLTGTVPAGQLPQFTGGDVTTAGAGSVNLTIGPATVTLAKMANLAANSIIGNNTGAGATPIALTVAQVKALLAIAVADITGLGYFATGTSAANLTGTLAAAQMPGTSGGDISNTAGNFILTIGANKVTRGMLAQTVGATILGATAAGNVADLTAAQAKTFLAIVAADVGGLGYFATGTNAANLTGTVAAAQLPQFTGGDVTTGGAGSVNLSIGAATVTYAKIQNVAASKLLGNPTGGAASVSEIPLAGGLFFTGSALVGAVIHPGYVSGNWYCTQAGVTTQAGGVIAAAGSIRLLPFTISKPITISDLAARVTTVSSGGSFQLAIYAHNSTTGRPTGNALCSTGNISTTTLAAVSATVGGGTLIPPGTYWGAINQNNTAAAYQTVLTSASDAAYLIGSATLTNVSVGSAQLGPALSVAQAFGSWPDLTGATFVERIDGQNALLFVKAA